MDRAAEVEGAPANRKSPCGAFIAPDASLRHLADPAASMGIHIWSHKRAFDGWTPQPGLNPALIAAIGAIQAFDLPCEDQCSAQYYLELWMALKTYKQSLRRIVEVGVYLGGCTALFAESIRTLNCTLDLVDVDPSYLVFTHERIRRQRPEVIDRVRLYCGDLPSYVQNVLLREDAGKTFIHNDGAHDFNQVVRDLASLSFVQDKVTAIAMQDTNLRGTPKYMNFVDLAVYAVFGTAVKYVPIGATYSAANQLMMTPNQYQGNYFRPGAPEGWIIPLACNTFEYPHPSLQLQDFQRDAVL